MAMATLIAAGRKALLKALPKYRRTASVDRASDHVLHLCRTNLEVRLQSVDEMSLSPRQKEIFADIIAALQSPMPEPADPQQQWDELYKLKRLSVLLLNGQQLQEEITHRMQELHERHVPRFEAFRPEYETLIGSAPEKKLALADEELLRAFLLHLMETLQWAAKETYLAEPIRAEASNKIVCGLLGSSLLLIVGYVWHNINDAQPHDSSPWGCVALPLCIAIMSGALGTFFSRLMVLRGNWAAMSLEQARLYNDPSNVFLRASVGMAAALILFFSFRAGFLTETIFPQFDDISLKSSSDAAKLMLWCVIAGFSERLVPGLLENAERRLAPSEKVAGGTAL